MCNCYIDAYGERVICYECYCEYFPEQEQEQEQEDDKRKE